MLEEEEEEPAAGAARQGRAVLPLRCGSSAGPAAAVLTAAATGMQQATPQTPPLSPPSLSASPSATSSLFSSRLSPLASRSSVCSSWCPSFLSSSRLRPRGALGTAVSLLQLPLFRASPFSLSSSSISASSAARFSSSAAAASPSFSSSSSTSSLRVCFPRTSSPRRFFSSASPLCATSPSPSSSSSSTYSPAAVSVASGPVAVLLPATAAAGAGAGGGAAGASASAPVAVPAAAALPAAALAALPVPPPAGASAASSSAAREKKEKKKQEETSRGCCGLSYSQFVRRCAAALSSQQVRRVAALLFCYQQLKCRKASSKDAVLRRVKKIFPEEKREEVGEILRSCIDIIEPQEFHRLVSQLSASRLLLPQEDIHENLPQSGVGEYTSAAAFQQQQPFLLNAEEELESEARDEDEEEQQQQAFAGEALGGRRVQEERINRRKREGHRRKEEEAAAEAEEMAHSEPKGRSPTLKRREEEKKKQCQQQQPSKQKSREEEKKKKKKSAGEAAGAVGGGGGGRRSRKERRAREASAEGAQQDEEQVLPFLFGSSSQATDVAATAYGLLRQVAKRPPQATRYQEKRVGEFLVDLRDPAVPPPGSSSKRLVFISNIPPGPRKKITNAIKKAFVGCGEIVNIEIFNDRLRTIDERDEMSMQRRGSKASSDKLAGRFSPVFAIAEFATEEAKRKACSTYLRVFGVPCIDRLLYVDDAADRTTLVASNLPFALATHEVARILVFALVSDVPAHASPPCVCRLTMTNPEVYGYNHLVVEARSDRPKPYFVLSPVRGTQQLQQSSPSHGLLETEPESAAAAAAAAAIDDGEADAAVVNECVQPHVFLSVFGSPAAHQSTPADALSTLQQEEQLQQQQGQTQEEAGQSPDVPGPQGMRQQEPQEKKQDGTNDSSPPPPSSRLRDIGRSTCVATGLAGASSSAFAAAAAGSRPAPPPAGPSACAATAGNRATVSVSATKAAPAAGLATEAAAAGCARADCAGYTGAAAASSPASASEGPAAAFACSAGSDLLVSRVSRAGDINEDVFIPTAKLFDASSNPKDVSNVFPVLRQDQDMANLVLKKVLMDRLAIQNDGMFLLRFSSFEAAAVAIRKCRDMVLFDSRALLLFSPRRCVCIDGKMVDMPLRR